MTAEQAAYSGQARSCICQHETLCLDPSSHAAVVGYCRPSAEKRATAAGLKSTQSASLSAATFPAPLVLPGDHLALDPKCPPQSLRSWLRLEDRNAVTPERNVIYVAPPPHVEDEVEFMKSWSQPKISYGAGKAVSIAQPRAQDVLDYLTAFYHPLPVKLLNTPLAFCNWETPLRRLVKPSAPKYIGLKTNSELIGIRTRRCDDKTFPRQVNLDDLLDAAMSILPQDAYALLMLTEQDLYEDDDDSFCCGKAYGGSRVSIASMARYNPSLDTLMGVDREHSWPASHCGEYVHIQGCGACKTHERLPPKKKAKLSSSDSSSPLSAAVNALVLPPHHQQQPASSSSLYLARICRTASHELGHCFGFDHCTYYACVMQGCASLAEDARQPPYLCPVDLAKLKHAVFYAPSAGDLKKEKKNKKKEKDEQDEKEWTEEMYRALERVCGRMRQGDGEGGTGGFWDAFSIWLKGRLHEHSTKHE